MLPANAFGLHVAGTVDNYAWVYANGNYQGYVSAGSCAAGTIQFDVPNSELAHGSSNLIAVRAEDDGNTASYFDLQATYGAIQFGNQPIETQKASPLTDGSGNPIQVTITDAEGDPVSGATVDVSLQTTSGSGTISGDTEETTGEDGVASFSDLDVSAPGTYQPSRRATVRPSRAMPS
jgi:hypothetical protein